MTKVIIETAVFQDAIKKAESIAPEKGMAFDKAAGIVLHVDSGNENIIVRSTNLDVYFMEWVDTLELVGDDVTWRLPSRVLGSFIGSLPIGSGKTVSLEQKVNQVEITSGRSKCTLRLIDYSLYPMWAQFDEDNMISVVDLGAKLSTVEWAASKDVPAMGVRLTGDKIMGTNRYKLAVMPLKIDGIEEGITIPPATLSGILKKVGDCKVRVNGGQLLVVPDESTQIMTIMIGEPFPPVERIMRRDYADSVTFKKQWLLDMIARTTKITANRWPVLRLIVGQEELATWMTDDERGSIGDVIALPGQADHLRVYLPFDPTAIVDGLSNSPSEEVTFYYDRDKPDKALGYITDKAGYECWLAPRGQPPKGSETESTG